MSWDKNYKKIKGINSEQQWVRKYNNYLKNRRRDPGRHAEIMIRQKLYQLAYNDLKYLLQFEETQAFAQNKIDELDGLNLEE